VRRGLRCLLTDMASTPEDAPSAYAVTVDPPAVPAVDEKAIKKAAKRNAICNSFIKVAVLLLIAVLLAIPVAVPLILQRARSEPEKLVFYSNNARVPGLIVDTTYTIITNKTVRSKSSAAGGSASRNRPPVMIITNSSAGIPNAPPGVIQIIPQPPLPRVQDPMEMTPVETAASFSRFNPTNVGFRRRDRGAGPPAPRWPRARARPPRAAVDLDRPGTQGGRLTARRPPRRWCWSASAAPSTPRASTWRTLSRPRCSTTPGMAPQVRRGAPRAPRCVVHSTPAGGPEARPGRARAAAADLSPNRTKGSGGPTGAARGAAGSCGGGVRSASQRGGPCARRSCGQAVRDGAMWQRAAADPGGAGASQRRPHRHVLFPRPTARSPPAPAPGQPTASNAPAPHRACHAPAPGALPAKPNRTRSPPPPRPAADQTGKEVVDDILQRAAAAGLTTVRTWAHTQASTAPFQLAPGQYSEKGLKALDYVLDSARRAGLQVGLGSMWRGRRACGAAGGRVVARDVVWGWRACAWSGCLGPGPAHRAGLHARWAALEAVAASCCASAVARLPGRLPGRQGAASC
jgi:hypothetical protein